MFLSGAMKEPSNILDFYASVLPKINKKKAFSDLIENAIRFR